MRRTSVSIGLVLLALILSSITLAQGSYDLSWFSVDGGSSLSTTGGVYTIAATIGQPDAGRIVGSGYMLNGGFRGLQASTVAITPTAPVLLTPANAAFVNTPVVTWKAVPDGGSYEVQIDNSSLFNSLDATGIVNALSYTATLPATSGTLYYWRTRARNFLDTPGAWSAVRSFTLDTVAPGIPVQTAPANGATVTTLQPTFSWGLVAGAARYELQLGLVNPPTTTVANAASSTYVPPGSLLLTTYYWHVRAIDRAGNASAFSTVRSVNIQSALVSAPRLYRYETATPTLTWGAVTWAAGYEVQVDNLNTFASPDYQNNTIPTNTLQVTTLPLADGTWYWRVRAKNTNGTWGIWSPITTIVIDVP